MRHLKLLDKRKRLQFESIWSADFSARFPEVDVVEANRILHGKRSDGQMLYGLDVTYAAWSAVVVAG